ncbi:YbaB/EbfC family nucleoid-associated protein [Patescibacteria group bacterium]|nr:YbaB/EbfC family nucleoid-associated protein [Patescibacteria group bacterium]
MPNPFKAAGVPLQLLKLQAQARKMKKKLAAQSFEFEEDGVRVVVNGNRELREIEIDGEENRRLVKVLNRALKNAQEQAAKEMFAGGGADQLLDSLK